MVKPINQFSDEKIIESWKKNAAPWIEALERNTIESRIVVTNHAIVEKILSKKPEKVLDIGCGEGWLSRVLVESDIDCLGVDVVPDLINKAKLGKGRFQLISYEELSYSRLGEQFDVLVANFSLIGEESVESIFQQANNLLKKGGSLIIQTVHPKVVDTNLDYVDGWREGSWAGFGNNFCAPAPWYFRTLESWSALFEAAGFDRLEIVEPLNPKNKNIASLILVGERWLLRD